MRNREISFVNVVLCLLVMWIHICSVAVTGLPKENISFFGVYVPWRPKGRGVFLRLFSLGQDTENRCALCHCRYHFLFGAH